MVAITAPAKVLVTGASGFLGTQLTRELLAHGYTVVGTGEFALSQSPHSGNNDLTLLIISYSSFSS